jgi:hypothetical protein
MEVLLVMAVFVCLFVCLFVWRKRAILLCWLVHRGNKGHFPVEMHLQLLDFFSRLLPLNCRVILLEDGEFSKIELLDFVKSKAGMLYAVPLKQAN